MVDRRERLIKLMSDGEWHDASEMREVTNFHSADLADFKAGLEHNGMIRHGSAYRMVTKGKPTATNPQPTKPRSRKTQVTNTTSMPRLGALVVGLRWSPDTLEHRIQFDDESEVVCQNSTISRRTRSTS